MSRPYDQINQFWAAHLDNRPRGFGHRLDVPCRAVAARGNHALKVFTVAVASAARLTRLREAMPLSNAIAGIDLRCEPGWLRRLLYPVFAALAAAAAPGRCAADATRSNMTCLMPSMRKPARSKGLNAACTSGLASWRLMNWGCVMWYR